MSDFRPKELFLQAKKAERAGKRREASAQYATLCIYLRKKGKKEDSLTLIDRAILLSPKSPRLYLQQALCRVGMGDEVGAANSVATFTHLAIEQKKSEEYRPYLETTLKEFPQLKEVFYKKLLALDRTNAAPFLAQAKSLREQGKSEEAKNALIDALKTKSDDTQVLGELSDLMEEQGRSEDVVHLKSFENGRLSRDHLISLLSRAPASAPVEQEIAPQAAEPPEPSTERNLRSLIRDLESKIGNDLAEPIDDTGPLIKEFRRRSQKILANDSKARLDMALAFFEMGLIDDARDEIKPIEVSDPLYPESQALLGEILLAEGSDLGALEAYQNCLRDERASQGMIIEGKYKLLQIYYRLGDLKQALTQLRELEKTAPDYRDLRYLKMRILEALGVTDE